MKVIIIEEEKRAYIIHSPTQYTTAVEKEKELKENGYDVFRLNTGVEYEEKLAEKLLERCPE
jgi:L-alanine-DL-glutamate epimerase-like enolase superfamily enzyme